MITAAKWAAIEQRLLPLEPEKNLPEPVEPRVRLLNKPMTYLLPGGKLPPLISK